tara:strand:- start:1377 stop:1745 length:369 start_codon:yes stop_codon:yes gene_type:complete
MIDDLVSGKIAVADNVLGSYVVAQENIQPLIEVILLSNSPTTMMRSAFVPRKTNLPDAAARPLSRTPERMALVAAGIGCVSALVGLRAAYIFDTLVGPTIVCAAALIFAALSIKGSVHTFRK